MKKTYAAMISRDDPRYGMLRNLGIEPAHGILFSLDSQDPRWQSCERLFRADPDCFRVECEFTSDEVLSANWVMLSLMPRGFPQPEDGYLSSTYSLTARCACCGIGREQIAPFSVKGNLLRKADICCTLEWVGDAAFVPSEIFTARLHHLTIASRPILDFRTSSPIPNWCQLIPQCELEFAAIPPAPEYVEHRCEFCGRRKWRRSPGGFLAPVVPPAGQAILAQSTEWFGEGAFAFRPLLAHRTLVRTLVELGADWRGWMPCSLESSGAASGPDTNLPGPNRTGSAQFGQA
jgi:hypothetical protein